MEKLVYQFNDEKYLLFQVELPVRSANNFDRHVKSHNDIIESIKATHRFWCQTSLEKYLIPAEEPDPNFK